ncbi:hypothetical protein PV11_07643 [Exophiala sideris]|uniref:Telomeric repeat-binding factor 2-interacting protein 1 n=1 Tax=Exophiala sideris TaxID=1016849 RepID=A0A0D1WY99_9EURO|nr:hypothetical protein PV11_07643 [Exophiala sideris]
MSTHIVYDNVPRTQGEEDNDRDDTRKLFAGQKLWFAHAVPQRHWLMENARLNGATVVNRDVDADIKLVDHARKNQAPGTHSYKYVEWSIRNAELENLADHAVGVSTRVARPVGSTVTAPRAGRVPYTDEDDQFLWNWVKPFEDSGGAIKGNEIYKQIEQVNPRHTYQSWRDRYLKSTRFQKRWVTNAAQVEEPGPQQVEDDAERSTASPSPERARTPLSPLGKRKRGPEVGGERVRLEIQSTVVTRSPELQDPLVVGDPVAAPTVAEQHTAVEALQTVAKASPQAQQVELRAGEVKAQGGEDDTELSGLSPSNVGGGFSIKEYKDLYRMVPQLTESESDKFQGLWKELATSTEYPSHKPDQWKYFFEYRVVPDYCRNKKLKLEEVAPYLCARQESNMATGQHDDADQDDKEVHEALNEQEDQREQDEFSEARTSPGLMMCTNCYTNNSERWRHDKEGKPLCNECAVFLRTHGVPRPSTMGLDTIAEQAETSGTRPQTPSRLISPKKFTITPIVGSVQLPPILLPAEPSVAEAVYARTPPPKSPSFQPESPTLSRPPEPNSSRKRSAGRGSQSQSQSQSQSKSQSLSQPQSIQELNPSSTQSHTQPGSQPQPSEMGDTQSKETQPEEQSDAKSQNPSTAVPSFRATTGTRPRKILQDDPDNLDIQQDSSLSTDKGPPREPPVIPSTESDEEFSFPPFPLLGNRLGERLWALDQHLSQDSSSVSEDQDDDDGIEEEEDSVKIKQEKAATPDHEASPDVGTRANMMGQQAAEEPQPVGQRQREFSSKTDDTGGQEVMPESRRDASPEIPLQRLESGSQPVDNWETAPEQQQQGMNTERRLSTQALFDRPNTHDALDLGLEIPDPEGGWDSILGPGAANGPDHEHLGTVSEDNQAHDKQAAIPAREPGEDKGSRPEDNDHVHPSSTARSTIPVEPQAAQETSEDNSTTDQWIAYEESLHPDERNLRPICIKALECTSINFERASLVVEIMLDQLQHKRRRTSRSSFVTLNEIEIPEDMPGAWSDEDDRLLLSNNMDDVLGMVAKHGRANCDARFEFLFEYAEK